ncbi:WD40 repeat domain-containing protein [Streptomyces sp. NPDC048362]|uniref:WD40 repeat domain-containing protein n=1 Tax=Streptomyces sp. NPDC048362 TaxID=3365539 RepID=UPI0037246043
MVEPAKSGPRNVGFACEWTLLAVWVGFYPLIRLTRFSGNLVAKYAEGMFGMSDMLYIAMQDGNQRKLSACRIGVGGEVSVTFTSALGDGSNPPMSAVPWMTRARDKLYLTNWTTGDIAIWDIAEQNPKLVKSLSVGSNAAPSGLAVSPDGQTLYSANAPRNPRTGSVSAIRDLEGQNPSVLTATAPGPCEAVAVSPDGAYLYTTGYRFNGRKVIVWDVSDATRPPQQVGSVDVGGANYIAYPDAARKEVYTAKNDIPGVVSTVDVSDPENPKCTTVLDLGEYNRRPTTLVPYPGGKFLLASMYMSDCVGVINLLQKRVVAFIGIGTSQGAPIAVAVSSDGKKIYTANNNTDTAGSVTANVTELDVSELAPHWDSSGGAPDQPPNPVYQTGIISAKIETDLPPVGLVCARHG